MDKLIQHQADILDSMQQMERNFKKDPASRKTRDYIEQRLNKLDQLWAEFKKCDDKLGAYHEQHPYFEGNQFEQARDYYNAVRQKISACSVTQALEVTAEEKPGPSLLTPTRFSTEIPTSQAPQRHTDTIAELLTLQRTNFRAFNRLTKSISVDQINDKWELEDELNNLQCRWKAIDALHLQIDNILQGSDSSYDEEFEFFEKLFKSIKRALHLKLASTAHLHHSTPQLDIPVFTGRYTQWPTFYDLFCESIHNNNLLTKSQKMQHLKGKLKGEAERLVQHLHISADNYDTAWDLLVHRYSNPQVLFTKNIEIFLAQPIIHKQTANEIKRLYDVSMESIHAIQNLGVDTTTWDPLLVHIITKKLDQGTYTDYKESRKSPRDLPSLTELMQFLESKFTALEPIHRGEKTSPPVANKPYYSQPKINNFKSNRTPYLNSSSNYKREYLSSTTCNPWSCPFCNQRHVLYKCFQFNKLKPDAKLKTVRKLQVCECCLFRHYDTQCNSNKTCKYCQREHHTMLHDAFIQGSAMQTRISNANKSQSVHPSHDIVANSSGTSQPTVNHVATDDEEILLTTLSLRVKAADGTFVTLRALLDQGSQISLISERAVQLLGLPRQRYYGTVSGVGHGTRQSKGIVTLECNSIHDDYEFTTQALVINYVINNNLPNSTFTKRAWSHLQHINLADPEYNVSRPIDLLLDASVYSDIIMSGLIKGPNTAPIAQQTKLGWILSGNVKTFNCHVIINNVSDLSQYWELEEVKDTTPILSSEDQYCEDLYKSTTRRLSNGRYEVALPMKPDFQLKLGLSKSKAVAQFRNIEHKMLKNSEFSQSYLNFMSDYESMGHMKRVINRNMTSCYLPHHGVIKSDSSTTKLRTVFNASCKTSSGNSLNDLMERGPNLQKDLTSLIISWRRHKYVVTADIEKMFRQILVREEDQHLQRIIWRYSPSDEMTDYQLTTVTYGTKAAPYLAMRTLHQLAVDDASKFPLAAETLKYSFYMDDLLEGSETIEGAKILQSQVIKILKGAGMNIRKWSSNAPELVNDLPSDQIDTPLDFKCSETRKTLGIRWNAHSDSFTFQNKFSDLRDEENLTKRALLSHISKIFDPLGWLSPLTIRAKLLFQKTWSDENISWDDIVSDAIKNEWMQIKFDFQNLNNIEIPRYLGSNNYYEIHGFCDASEKAYACSVYIVTRNNKGVCTSKLLTAKTKVAPLKNKESLPRLELCGAFLLSRLLKQVLSIYTKTTVDVYAWTDSMVVLGWIHGDVNRWKHFVSNRVQKIINIVPASRWHHVKSEHNPADCATRGLTIKQLTNHSAWWEGPEWLLDFDSNLLCNKKYQSPTIETKKASVNVALYDTNSFIIKLLNECSSISRMVTTIGWLSRYIRWIRDKQNASRRSYLSVSEINNSYNLIIRTVQYMEFQEDIHRLSRGEHLRKSSKLLCLNPYIDQSDGLLRIGGRLNNSTLRQSAKHPIILPSHNRLTELLIIQAHLIMLHGGPSLTLSYIREKFWIISGLRTVKRELRKCVKCRRFNNSEKNSQIMADLPQPRVTASRPFTHTGVDFTGHFEIKANKGRGVKTLKGYVAVFVCLATKAVHLELVSDLSTPGFLAAFRRFCARRGTPSHMYSDNGTNFVGANRLLKKEYHEILQTIDTRFFNEIREYNVRWIFNAPAYPSAGGLWEAAVKRMKYHLRRVVGEQKLTYEEFITLLHQIEACLNSRPLIGLTENPDDQYLTPGHFLIGDALISRPQTDPHHINLTTRWQMVQAMHKRIWKCWSTDYLQQLQIRSKWNYPQKNIEIDDIVLVKEDNLPPGKWALGRVTYVHPGKDGHVRVVTLKTKNGEIKRPILKLSVLPVKENEQAFVDINEMQRATSNEKDAPNSRDSKQKLYRTSRRSNRLVNFIMTFLLFFFILSPVQSKSMYNVTYFNGNQSIYFDRICNIHLIQDEWKLVVYYNMTTFWTGLNNIRDYITRLDTQTYGSTLPSQYKSILYQLQHDLAEIEHYNSLLRSQIGKRKKRGLINGIGYLANTLFGVLDERFATQYELDIKRISLNENHLQALLRNQTSVIEGQYNVLRRNENIMNKQFGILDNHLRAVSLSLSEVETELHILSSSLSANIVISGLKRIQDNLINIITDISQGHINVHLLPPEQLLEQINIINSHLQGDLVLPVDKQSIRELYKLMKVRARVGAQYLIMEVKIPLVKRDSLQLDQLLSLPNKYYYVLTNFPYMAFNLQKNLLIFLTETDIQTCTHYLIDSLLCVVNRPIYELPITKSICNITINNKTMCSTKVSACEERWVKLHANNRWLFSCCEKCLVRIFCSNGMQQSSLTGNGILDIGSGCVLKSNDLSIYGHNENLLSHIYVQNDIPIIPEISVLNKIFNSSFGEHYVPENHTHQWNRLRTQIDNLQEESTTTLSVHDVHQYTVLYTTLVLILLAGGTYSVVRCKARRRILQLSNVTCNTVKRATTEDVQSHSDSPGTSGVQMVTLNIPRIDRE